MEPTLSVFFFCTESEHEPVRTWLKKMDKNDRKAIGEDVKLVQFRWPLGMPLVKKMETNLWEVRSYISGSKIARVFFTIYANQMILLHGFIKKSKKTPGKDVDLARCRKNQWLSRV